MIELTKVEQARVKRMARNLSIDGITEAIISRREFDLFQETRKAVVEAVDGKMVVKKRKEEEQNGNLEQ